MVEKMRMGLCKMVAGRRGCSCSSSVRGLAAFSVGLLAVAAAFVVVTANGKTIQIVVLCSYLFYYQYFTSLINFERSIHTWLC